MELLKDIIFDENGLIPAIVQDSNNKKVLMLAYMNEEALMKTIETGRTWFYSRSRQSLWNKGESSGHFQDVVSLDYDCDGDTLLINVKHTGAACHTGAETCFYRNIVNNNNENNEEVEQVIYNLYKIIENRRDNPKEGSYTNYLFEKGLDKILKKIGEESSEVIIGAKNQSKEETIYEISDLVYHTVVLMVQMGIKLEDIKYELYRRYSYE